MKTFLIFTLLFLLFLTGCSNTPNSNTTEYDSTQLSYHETKSIPEEELLSFFSTEILTNDSNRQNNITLTCQALNGYIVKSGETFSFCNILGPAKPENGYLKANTFDNDGNTIKAYGGGKCQVSTTLYNAVIAVPNLTVVERHLHSASVYYVPDGMDACINYGTCDFQFRNDNDFDIKLYFSNTPNTVDVSIVKLSS